MSMSRRGGTPGANNPFSSRPSTQYLRDKAAAESAKKRRANEQRRERERRERERRERERERERERKNNQAKEECERIGSKWPSWRNEMLYYDDKINYNKAEDLYNKALLIGARRNDFIKALEYLEQLEIFYTNWKARLQSQQAVDKGGYSGSAAAGTSAAVSPDESPPLFPFKGFLGTPMPPPGQEQSMSKSSKKSVKQSSQGASAQAILSSPTQGLGASSVDPTRNLDVLKSSPSGSSEKGRFLEGQWRARMNARSRFDREKVEFLNKSPSSNEIDGRKVRRRREQISPLMRKKRQRRLLPSTLGQPAVW